MVKQEAAGEGLIKIDHLIDHPGTGKLARFQREAHVQHLLKVLTSLVGCYLLSNSNSTCLFFNFSILWVATAKHLFNLIYCLIFFTN